MSISRVGTGRTGCRSDSDLLSAVRDAKLENERSGLSSLPRRRRTGSEAGLRSSPSARSVGRIVSGGASRRSGSGRSCARTPMVMTVQQQQEAVLQTAMDRYVEGLEKEAHDAVEHTASWHQTVKAGKDQERDERSRRMDLERKNQQDLMNQIQSNKLRNAETRKEFVVAASSHEFPLFTETFISQVEVDEYRKAQKVQFRAELSRQQKTISTFRNLQAKHDRDFAEEQLQKKIQEMRVERDVERRRVAEMGVTMTDSWDRDVRLKSLKKAILQGKNVVHDLQGHVVIPDVLTLNSE